MSPLMWPKVEVGAPAPNTRPDEEEDKVKAGGECMAELGATRMIHHLVQREDSEDETVCLSG